MLLALLPFHGELALAATCTSKPAKDIVIVLDVGHVAPRPKQRCPLGPTCSWGETSARGVPEYDLNLKLAESIRQEMVDEGLRSATVMVTQTGGDDGLLERAARANRMKADIYLSIHHDGVSDSFLKPWQYQGQQYYYYDDASGFSLHVSDRFPESLSLARLLADQLLASGLHFTTVHVPSNPAGARKPFLDSTRGIYRRDDLAVLRFTDMPAVLLEAGMIVNRDEELVVSTPAYQATIAMAATAAVKKFCNVREVVPTYKVIDVASDDFLSIQSGPGAVFSGVGTIPPAGRGVRITGACSGQWCPIDYQGMRGWVNRRFLAGE